MYYGKKQTFYADGQTEVVDAAAEEAAAVEAARLADVKQLTEYYDHGCVDKTVYIQLSEPTEETLTEPVQRAAYDTLMKETLYEGKWKNDNYNAEDLAKTEELAKTKALSKFLQQQKIEQQKAAKAAEEAQQAAIKVTADTAEEAVKALLDAGSINTLQWHTFLKISKRLPKMTSLKVFDGKLVIEEEDGSTTTIADDGSSETVSADGTVQTTEADTETDDEDASETAETAGNGSKKKLIIIVSAAAAAMLITTLIILLIKLRKK